MEGQVMWDATPKLLEGALLTLELVLLSGFIGLLLAIPLAMGRTSKSPWVRALPFGYIFFFRGTPLLVQIFLVYYGAAQFDIIRETPWLWSVLSKPYWCAIITFSLHTAGYIAEILRGAIQAVPAGEIEAAEALGMRKQSIFRRIIFPRAWRIALPSYGNELILMLKASALASTITLLDLTGMARTVIAKNYMPVETFLTAGIIYLFLTFLITMFIKWLEKVLNPQNNPRAAVK